MLFRNFCANFIQFDYVSSHLLPRSGPLGRVCFCDSISAKWLLGKLRGSHWTSRRVRVSVVGLATPSDWIHP